MCCQNAYESSILWVTIYEPKIDTYNCIWCNSNTTDTSNNDVKILQ